MRKLKITRAVGTAPQKWELRHNKKGVWYTITVLDTIKSDLAPDTEFVMVKLKQVADLADPDNDVALLLGKILLRFKSGALNHNRPELWFYNDKFWVMGNDTNGLSYYKKKQYAFHSIELEDADGLFASIEIPGS